MRKIVILTAVILLFAFGNSSAGQFGAPQPFANEQGFALGAGYFYSQNKWEPSNNSTGTDYKMTRNEVYLQGSGATKYAEGYLRLGGADMNFEDGKGIGNDFKDSGRIYGGVGARGIYQVTPYFGIGPVVQASLYDNFTDSIGSTTFKMKDLWEVGVALAFQGNIGNNLILYAGPYLYWSQFKIDGGSSWEAKGNFGGMGGVRFKINHTFSIEAEGQYTNEFSAGGFLSVSF